MSIEELLKRDVGSALYFVSDESAVTLVHTLHCVDESLYPRLLKPSDIKAYCSIVAEGVMDGSWPSNNVETVCVLV